MNLDLYQKMLNEICGITYPTKIIERRLKALTPDDLKEIEELEDKIRICLDSIDAVISTRAEINEDYWEIGI